MWGSKWCIYIYLNMYIIYVLFVTFGSFVGGVRSINPLVEHTSMDGLNMGGIGGKLPMIHPG